jgi:hypothetical protein
MGRYVVQDLGRHGYIDASGAIAISLKFSHASAFSNGYAWVFTGEEHWLIDENGDPCIRDRFAYKEDVRFDRVKVKTLEGKMGLLSVTGEWVIPPEYDNLFDWYGPIVLVIRDRQKGLYRLDGRGLTTFGAEGVEVVSDERLALKRDGRWALTDYEGEPLTDFCYDSIGLHSEGRIDFRRNGLAGFLDLQGREIVAPTYKFALGFREGFARVVAQDDLVGFIDPDGRQVVEPRFCVAQQFSDRRALASLDKTTFGYLGPDGEWAIAPEFSGAEPFRWGRALVTVDRKQGVIELDGSFRIPARYNYLSNNHEGWFLFKKGSRRGLMDDTGRVTIPEGLSEGSQILGPFVTTDLGYMSFEGEYLWLRSTAPIPVYEPPPTLSVDYSAFPRLLDECSARDPERQRFGAEEHNYEVGPALSDEAIAALEEAHGITLPSDYRRFLRDVGDGGAGPGYGLFSLEEAFEMTPSGCWSEPFVAATSLDEAWSSELLPGQHPGILQISDDGCDYCVALILTGPERGTVWFTDGRAWLPITSHFPVIFKHHHFDHDATYEYLLSHSAEVVGRTRFFDWYHQWLHSES